MASEGLAIAWSTFIDDFKFVLRITLFVIVTLNLLQFVIPGVMVGLTCFMECRAMNSKRDVRSEAVSFKLIITVEK